MLTPDHLYLIPKDVCTRWASPENPTAEKGRACFGDDGRKRRSNVPLRAGESLTLLDIRGTSGTVRRIWITLLDRSPKMLRGLRLEAWWDNAAEPAVSVPLGDFFSFGLGRMTAFQSALFSSPEGKSFNCCVPMPFRNSARIVITNETDVEQGSIYYDVNCTVGDVHSQAAAYLHAHWRRENHTTFMRDFEILPRVEGRGRFLGSNMGVIVNTETYFKTWWGEGEVKAYLDGDTANPTLCGTGTEDYIGAAYGQGQFSHLYQGCPVADQDKFQYCFYRLHLPDPIWFQQSARITIQQLGCWEPQNLPTLYGAGVPLMHGNQPVDVPAKIKEKWYGYFERQDDWSSCAWFYLDKPTNGLPALAPLADCLAGL